MPLFQQVEEQAKVALGHTIGGESRITKQCQIMDAMDNLKSEIHNLEGLKEQIQGTNQEPLPKSEIAAPRHVPALMIYLEQLPEELHAAAKWIANIRISIHEALY